MSGAMVVATAAPAPRFLDAVRQAGLERFGREDVAQRWVDWTRRFILFHNKRHPREMGAAEIAQFLQHTAQTGGSVDDVLNGREALTQLYEHVLCQQVAEVALPAPPRLLDRVRLALRVRHYSPRTEACYLDWATRYIRFHGLRHPQEMAAAEVTAFLTDLAVRQRVSASTQNQALNALVFLYGQVLGLELGRLDAVRAKRGKYLPTILAPEEVRRLLDGIEGGDGACALMGGLAYGAGLRRVECCAVRVHHLDLARGQIHGAAWQGGQGSRGHAAEVLAGCPGAAAGVAAGAA